MNIYVYVPEHKVFYTEITSHLKGMHDEAVTHCSLMLCHNYDSTLLTETILY